MHCQNCDYLLFNLTKPVCPECGQDFDVERYRFASGVVSFNCPHCDQDYYGNDARGLPLPREFACIKCGERVRLQNMRVVPLTPDAVGWIGSSWDNRSWLGFWPAWWETLKATLFHPSTFYRTHKGTSLKKAWIFSTVAIYIGSIPLFFYQVLGLYAMNAVVTSGGLPGGTQVPLPGPMGFSGFPPQLLWLVVTAWALMALLMPLFMQFIVGGIWTCTIQLALAVLHRDRKPIDYTFRATMYSYGTFVLYAIPICGGYAAGIWQVVTLIHGVMRAHNVGGWKASIAVLWPIVVLASLYFALFVAWMSGLLG